MMYDVGLLNKHVVFHILYIFAVKLYVAFQDNLGIQKNVPVLKLSALSEMLNIYLVTSFP